MIGQRIADRYGVQAILSQGGTCRVYLCDDQRIPGARWVVKLADPSAVPAGVRLDAMMDQEAALLAHIAHPAIHRVVDRLAAEGCPGLVLDYVPGQTLEERVRRDGRLGQADALRVAEALADLLDYLHRLEPAVILVDLHPSNIILGPHGSVHVVDLGMARLAPGPAAGGRPGFVAPECTQAAEARSDLYSLGAVLYFMLTGELWDDSRGSRNVSRRSGDLLKRCLARDPRARFPSAASLKRALSETRLPLETASRIQTAVPGWVPITSSGLSMVSMLLLLLGAGLDARRVLPYDAVAPDSPLKVQARELLAQGHGSEALRLLRQVMEEDPQDGEASILIENLHSPDGIKLPCLASLSGLGRGQALEQLQGMSLAQREINRSGGIRGSPLCLVLCDDRSSLEEALRWAQKLGEDPTVPLILGPATTERTLAMEFVLGRHELPALSTGASHPRMWSGAGVFTVAGPLTVRMAPLMDDLLSRGLRRVCLVYPPQEEMGRDLAYFVRERLEGGGARIVCELSYPLQASDFDELLPAIRRSNPDSVFFSATSGSRVGEFARDLRRGGLSVPLYTNAVGYSLSMVRAGGDGIEGMRLVESFYPDSNRPEVKAFMAAFGRNFPRGQPTRSTVQAYDAVRLAAQVLAAAGPDRDEIRRSLASTGSTRPSYRGVSGWVSPGRLPGWEPTYILEIRDGRYVLVRGVESPP